MEGLVEIKAQVLKIEDFLTETSLEIMLKCLKS